jgi:F0F1-type ATP synthase assembly protein I
MAGASGNAHWDDLASAWTAVGEFTAAVAVYGAGGWFADRWLHTGHFLFLAGLILGMVLGVYVLIKRGDQAAAAAKARQDARASR